MSDEMFVRCCAPTLAGIKTGSMFSCEYADLEEMTDELRRLNRVLAPSGMCLLPLRFHDGKALLYLFELKQDPIIPIGIRNNRGRRLRNGADGLCCCSLRADYQTAG